MSAEPSVMVQFAGDNDDSGTTPQRLVALKHV